MSVFFGRAQDYMDLSEDEKNNIRLSAFVLIDLDKESLSTINTIIQAKDNIAIIPSKKHTNNINFIESYQENHNQLIVVSNEPLDLGLEGKIKVIRVSTAVIESIKLSESIIDLDTYPIFKVSKELSKIKILNDSILNNNFVHRIWEESGKIPNFIQVNNDSLEQANYIVNLLNNTPKVFGVIKTKNDLLYNVSFENFKNRTANGYFSYPIHKNDPLPILIPHKAGYYFSPDIIYTTRENQNNQKEFIGVPLDSGFDMTYHLSFNEIIKSAIIKNDTGHVSNGVQIVKDSIQGYVGLFKARAYFDTGLESRNMLKSSFTITAWIKPTALGLNNSILGKGEKFVLKLHEGKLTFTMAGIKDYISESSPILKDQWTHISLVHSQINNNLIFYINGVLTDKVDLIENYTGSNKNLIIGSNLWEEFFIGYLNNVKIWERELNESEIKFEFSQKKEIVNNGSQKYAIYLWASLIVVLMILILLIRFMIKNKKNKSLSVENQLNKFDDVKNNFSKNYTEQILCLGPLRIINYQGIDVANKLSPMLKKLFIIIYLQSLRGKTGITTKKLTELLWPGMNVQSAKNTRGTNIQNLRSILSDCSEIELVFQNKAWFIKTTDLCYNEYDQTSQLMNLFSDSKIDLTTLEEELPPLLKLLNKGRFLSNTSDAWLDSFIEKFSNKLIEFCFDMIEKLSHENHIEILYDIADVIYLYDELNEKALELKLQILIQQGKLSLAHNLFDNFAKLYQEIYKEPYNTSFEDIVSKYQTES